MLLNGFYVIECHKLKQIVGINKFNTSKLTNMSGMFQLCTQIEYLDLSNFNTSNVTSMEIMFNGCHKLNQIIGINIFNTSKVNNMSGMFQLCNEIEYLDLSNFCTSNVIAMEYMFASYGVSQVTNKHKRWYMIWVGGICIANILWAYIKLAGRGLA